MSESYEYDISVIVPIYNVEEYLEECLDSLLRQGNVKLEVIMIDDGSPDRCGDIADEYARKYANFVCYHISNGGVGHARNVGATKAHGKYIAFVDPDDIVVDGTYEKLYFAAETHGCELSICRVARFSSSHKDYSYLHEQTFFQYEPVSHISKNPWLVYDTTSWNKLILRSFFDREQFKFPEDIIYEDIPMVIPMHFLCNKVAMVWDVGYMWRKREGTNKSLTQQLTSKKSLSDRLESMCMLDRFYDEHVSDQIGRKMKEIKVMKIDLFMFIMQLGKVTSSQAYETIDTINRYIDDHIGVEGRDSFSESEVIAELPLMYQQIYAYLRERDLESLRKALKYWEQYKAGSAIVEDKEKHDLLVNLPNSLFPMSNRSVLKEKTLNRPRAMIESVAVKHSKCNIQFAAYYPGINIPDATQQTVTAQLIDTRSGESVPLDVSESNAGRKLTEARGEMIERPGGNTVHYNYDGTGAGVVVDLASLVSSVSEKGSKTFRVLIGVKNRFFTGTRFLSIWKKNAVKHVRNRAYIIGNAVVHISFEMFGEILLNLVDNPTFAWKAKKRKNKLLLVTRCFESSKNRSSRAELCISDNSAEGVRAISRARLFRMKGVLFCYFVIDFGKHMTAESLHEGDNRLFVQYQRRNGNTTTDLIYRFSPLNDIYNSEGDMRVRCCRTRDSVMCLRGEKDEAY